MTEHCCEQIAYYLSPEIQREGVSIEYDPCFREYGIKISDGGSSVVNITHCPWCGSELQKTLRDKWFELLEEIIPDFDGFADPRIPDEFKTDEWWKKRGL